MCGIAGIYNFDSSPASLSEIRLMVSQIEHRGPDAKSWITNGPAALGHTRLAIIDLREESNQPFYSSCGRYILTYNGEVFNYIELRAELEKLGYQFRTQSDTEVVLQAYIAWGDVCVTRFNGMWAFAIYDSLEHRLYCSRDRYGIKPFVYAKYRDRFLFGSEIKSLLAVCPKLKEPNYQAIAHCVKQGYSGGLEDTCFLNVKRLLPACNMIIQQERVSFQQYWEYPRGVSSTLSYGDAKEQVQELLDDSVRLRMRSDVPVGITLSSGLDSSAIANLMRSHSSEHIHSYTSSYANLESEVDVAQATSEKLKFEFHPITCTEQGFLDRLSQIIKHIESPHASSPMLPLWEIMRAARDSVKVVLEGQGADELFAGYHPIYFGTSVLQSLRTMQLRAAFKELQEAYRLTSSHHLLGKHYFYSNLVRSIYPGSHKFIRRFGRGDESVYIGPLADVRDYFLPKMGKFDDLLNERLAQAHSVELTNLLHYGDAISMAFGIESRLPFLDHRLVEAVFAMPSHFKMQGGVTKRVLRDAMRSTVPLAIIENRFKQGFTTPISTWFRQSPKDLIHDLLLSERCKSRGIFDTRRMQELIELHTAGKSDLGPSIFRWLTCEMWFREFIDE
jgi:asparagine synthase (glutamine-hydrolysing)